MLFISYMNVLPVFESGPEEEGIVRSCDPLLAMLSRPWSMAVDGWNGVENIGNIELKELWGRVLMVYP